MLNVHRMKRLRPFFVYYGGKWRIAQHYQVPLHSTIVEPFAGSAGYSLHYPQLQVYLYDADERICELWNYLIRVKKSEILGLPTVVNHVDEVKCCQEAKWLIGYWLNKGTSSPSLRVSTWAKSGLHPNSYWREVIRQRIANQVQFIRHWKVQCRSYEDVDNKEATWFIDPPYQGVSGSYYRKKVHDYTKLADWCRSRLGYAIVCEQDGADWLPFSKFRLARVNNVSGNNGKLWEVNWTNWNL